MKSKSKIHVKCVPKSTPEAFRGDLPRSLSLSSSIGFPGKLYCDFSKNMQISFETCVKIHVKNAPKSIPEACRGDLSLSLSLRVWFFS